MHWHGGTSKLHLVPLEAAADPLHLRLLPHPEPQARQRATKTRRMMRAVLRARARRISMLVVGYRVLTRLVRLQGFSVADMPTNY